MRLSRADLRRIRPETCEALSPPPFNTFSGPFVEPLFGDRPATLNQYLSSLARVPGRSLIGSPARVPGRSLIGSLVRLLINPAYYLWISPDPRFNARVHSAQTAPWARAFRAHAVSLGALFLSLLRAGSPQARFHRALEEELDLSVHAPELGFGPAPNLIVQLGIEPERERFLPGHDSLHRPE